QHDQDGWSVRTVSGDIDIATAPSIREQVHSLLADEKHRLIIDLDDVGFLDSTALGVLVGALKRARMDDGEVRIACAQPRVLKVFEITRLDSAFDLFDSVEEAARGARE